MPKCTFCKRELRPGTGKLFIYNNGKTAYFCSRKCEKNALDLKRKPVKTKWTGFSHEERNKSKNKGDSKK